jgi:hypothetical protein
MNIGNGSVYLILDRKLLPLLLPLLALVWHGPQCAMSDLATGPPMRSGHVVHLIGGTPSGVSGASGLI